MGKHVPSDYNWSWWPGDPDPSFPSRPEDEAGQEAVPASSPTAGVPADPPFLDDASIDQQPLARSTRQRRAARQRRVIRVVAPLLMLALIAMLVVVIRLPDASAQPAITQSDPGSITLSPTPGADIEAYIVGEVVHPGVYPLRSGDRVAKLLQEAGGPKPDADLVRVNLAAHVSDGEEVFVPRVGQPIPSGLPGGGPGKVNINTASAEDMHTLLGISLTTANKIVAYREAHGPYTSITQLLNVMSRSTYDKIKNYITV